MNKKDFVVIVALPIIAITLLVLIFVLFLMPQMLTDCKYGVTYQTKDECYCPVNEIKPTGVPEAVWVEDFSEPLLPTGWECVPTT